MNLLETKKLENKKTQIKISFEMKDSLKRAIPSIKWNNKDKVWEVGSRSGLKLSAWIEQAKKEFDIESIQNDIESFQNKKKSSVKITGHTFSFKETIKELGGFFTDGAWHVPASIAEKVQTKIDELNKARLANLKKEREEKKEAKLKEKEARARRDEEKELEERAKESGENTYRVTNINKWTDKIIERVIKADSSVEAVEKSGSSIDSIDLVEEVKENTLTHKFIFAYTDYIEFGSLEGHQEETFKAYADDYTAGEMEADYTYFLTQLSKINKYITTQKAKKKEKEYLIKIGAEIDDGKLIESNNVISIALEKGFSVKNIKLKKRGYQVTIENNAKKMIWVQKRPLKIPKYYSSSIEKGINTGGYTLINGVGLTYLTPTN